MTIYTDEDVKTSLQILGRTPGGDRLRQVLTTALLRVAPGNAEAGALSVEHGRRLFAAELLQALETAETPLGRPDAAKLIRSASEPVPFGRASPRRVPVRSPDDD